MLTQESTEKRDKAQWKPEPGNNLGEPLNVCHIHILSFFENRTSTDQESLLKGICRKERGVSYLPEGWQEGL